MKNKEKNKSIINLEAFKAMFVCISKTFFKSPSTYIFYFSFTIIIFLLAISKTITSKISTDFDFNLQIFNYILYAEISISCLSVGVQMIIKTSKIFLEPSNEGLDIVFISKPIKRIEIWFARCSFLISYFLVICFTNISLISLGASLYIDALSPERWLFLILGSFGAQVITFLITFSMVLIFGLFFGTRISRSIPTGILGCSYIVTNFATISASIIVPNNLDIINNNFNNWIKDHWNESRLEFESYIQNVLGNPNLTLSHLSSNNNTFIAKDGKIYISDISFDLNLTDYPSSLIALPVDKPEIFELVIKYFINSSNHSNPSIYYEFNPNIWMILIDYINPMSGIIKIAKTDSPLNIHNSINYYSNYKIESNDIPTSVNNRYISYQETKYDEPWALALSWSSVAIASFLLSSILYFRKEFK